MPSSVKIHSMNRKIIDCIITYPPLQNVGTNRKREWESIKRLSSSLEILGLKMLDYTRDWQSPIVPFLCQIRFCKSITSMNYWVTRIPTLQDIIQWEGICKWFPAGEVSKNPKTHRQGLGQFCWSGSFLREGSEPRNQQDCRAAEINL